jgi:hypothetical protein
MLAIGTHDRPPHGGLARSGFSGRGRGLCGATGQRSTYRTWPLGASPPEPELIFARVQERITTIAALASRWR